MPFDPGWRRAGDGTQVPLALWMTGWVGASLPKRVEGGDLFDRVEWGVKSEGAMVHTTLHTRAQPTRKPPRLMVRA